MLKGELSLPPDVKAIRQKYGRYDTTPLQVTIRPVDPSTLSAIPGARAGDLAFMVEARDASGIMDWVIMARSVFDTVRIYGDAPELSEISADFRLPLVDTIPAGTRVVVEAVVQDDQNFAVARADTVTVIP